MVKRLNDHYNSTKATKKNVANTQTGGRRAVRNTREKYTIEVRGSDM